MMHWSRFFALALALAAGPLISSPALAETGLSGGVKGGVNASTLGGNGFSDPSVHLGMSLGGFVVHPIASGFSLQGELLMTDRGADLEDVIGKSIDEALLFLELPILGRYDLALASSISAYGLLGIAPGYVIDSKTSEREDLSRFDLTSMLGAGANFDLGNHSITVELRAAIGLLNQLDREDGGTARTRSLAFYAGVTL